jgi:type II secretory pathway component PulF
MTAVLILVVILLAIAVAVLARRVVNLQRRLDRWLCQVELAPA